MRSKFKNIQSNWFLISKKVSSKKMNNNYKKNNIMLIEIYIQIFIMQF